MTGRQEIVRTGGQRENGGKEERRTGCQDARRTGGED